MDLRKYKYQDYHEQRTLGGDGGLGEDLNTVETEEKMSDFFVTAGSNLIQ